MTTISEDRLDRMERILLATMEQTQTHATQMAERDAIAHAGMDRLTERVDSLTVLVAELREGQARLTQFLTQAQEDQQNFRRWTKVALDRIDRTAESHQQQELGLV